MNHMYKYFLTLVLALIVLVPLSAANTQAMQRVVISAIAFESNTTSEGLHMAETQLAADPRKKFKKQKRRTPVDRKRKMKNGKNCPSF
jgi:glutamine cyclotransferase